METIEFPTLDVEAPAEQSGAIVAAKSGEVAEKKPALREIAIAEFGPWRQTAADTRKTLAGVQHDLSTAAKIKETRSLRQRLIGAPLADARATTKDVKSQLNTVSGEVGKELLAFEAEYTSLDALILPQIEAREAELEAERVAAAEKEAARVQAHRDALAKLAAPAEKVREPGMTAARIKGGIAKIRAIVIDRAAWEEFADRAEDQKAVTLERMLDELTTVEAAEAEAIRVAEARAEAERVAAANKAEADRLAAIAADLERQRAELQAQLEAASPPPAPEPEPVAEAPAPVARPITRIVAIPEAEAQVVVTAAEELPPVTLGQLGARLGFVVTAEFLSGLGFEARKEKTSHIYRGADFPAICKAISAHVLNLA